MTQEEAKELLPIIQAFAEGKTIQYSFRGTDWIDVNPGGAIVFSDNPSKYRIKPESKYRPFANRKECLQEMLKHQPFGWVEEDVDYCNIIHIGRYGVNLNIGIGNDYRNYKKAFNLKFIDGTPFGIKEEN